MLIAAAGDIVLDEIASPYLHQRGNGMIQKILAWVGGVLLTLLAIGYGLFWLGMEEMQHGVSGHYSWELDSKGNVKPEFQSEEERINHGNKN